MFKNWFKVAQSKASTSLIKLTPFDTGTPVMLDGKACIAADRGQAGIMLYGPYEVRAPGRYEVEFEVCLADDLVFLGDPVCFTLDVRANHGQVLLAERYILHSQLTKNWMKVTLAFELQEQRELEYRVASGGQIRVLASATVEVGRTGESRRIAQAKSQQEREWENEREFLDGYLRNVSGVIHVGANLGQERRYYWIIGLDIIWVEPIREIYDRLVDNISMYPRQRAINALLTSKVGEKVEFRIANNNGASSSILPLEDHAVIFPGISYSEVRVLTSTTLNDLVQREKIPLDQYTALTLDVEGAEKMVLDGASEVLSRFSYVKCEVADFPARTGTPTVADLDAILTAAGFAQLIRRPFAVGPNNVGTFWDIVWKKVVPGQPQHESGYTLPMVVNPLEVDGIEKQG